VDKRFIEESFPVKEISEISANEKNQKQGHISSLHIWWARRPLACSRATNYAALIPNSEDVEEWNKVMDFLVDLSKWNNSLNQNIIGKARKDILKANNGIKPKVLDLFAGGGAIPLEALRLGCESYANDYNPVAILIEKCTLEFPQKFRKKLINLIEKWGLWLIKEVKNAIGSYYQTDLIEKETFFGKFSEDYIVKSYIWARKVRCLNPSCEIEIPLLPQFWLSKKSQRNVALFPYLNNNKVIFKIVGDGYEDFPSDFDPKKGTISNATVTCPSCGFVIDGKSVKKQLVENKLSHEMLCVVLQGKKKEILFKIPSKKDTEKYNKASLYLEEKRNELKKKWGFDPLPDEFIHTPQNREYQKGDLKYNFISIVLYGITKWRDFFNQRQKLALITFTEKIREAYQLILEESKDETLSKAVVSYLSIALTKLATRLTTLSVWHHGSVGTEKIFGLNAFPMQWKYSEANPIEGTTVSSYFPNISAQLKILENLSNNVFEKDCYVEITNSSATKLPYEDNYFDAVFTDPPYYDNIPYSDLSDFFYVWLKRCIGELYPDLFSTFLTPKSDEIIAELPLLRGMNKKDAKKVLKEIKTSEVFEDLLSESFKEIYRVLKPEGIAIIVYAHKTTEGWETVINSLLNSGLNITASWPINTELKSRLRAKKTASLSSSIYIIARKVKKIETGFYPEIKKLLLNHLNKKLEKMWEEGISGADFYIAAIGAGIEIMGKYENIIDYEGNPIDVNQILEDIRLIVTNFALKQILHENFYTEVASLTRFYLLWRWNFQDLSIEFDEAKKLAQSVGIDLEKEWNKGFIKKSGKYIKILGPKERKIEKLEQSEDMIDNLHYILLLWEKGNNDLILERIKEKYGGSEVLFRVAQAISQSLTNDDKEKKLLDGFLSGRERIKESIKEAKSQDKIDRWTK